MDSTSFKQRTQWWSWRSVAGSSRARTVDLGPRPRRMFREGVNIFSGPGCGLLLWAARVSLETRCLYNTQRFLSQCSIGNSNHGCVTNVGWVVADEWFVMDVCYSTLVILSGEMSDRFSVAEVHSLGKKEPSRTLSVVFSTQLYVADLSVLARPFVRSWPERLHEQESSE